MEFRNKEYDMEYDKLNAEYIMDSLQWCEPSTPVLIWFNGKRYYIETIEDNKYLPELIVGKEYTE